MQSYTLFVIINYVNICNYANEYFKEVTILKFKSTNQASAIILFIFSITALGMLLTGQRLPNLLSIIITLIFLATFVVEFIITKELKNLLYLSFIVYFLILLPLILPLFKNTFLYLPIIIVSFLLIVIFLYHEFSYLN